MKSHTGFDLAGVPSNGPPALVAWATAASLAAASLLIAFLSDQVRAAAPPTGRQFAPVLVATLTGDHLSRLTFSPDGRTLAANHGRKDDLDCGSLILWEVASHRRRRRDVLPGTTPRSTSWKEFVFRPDGQQLAAISSTRAILWDLANRKIEAESSRGKDDIVQSLSLSSDGRSLAVVRWDGLALLDRANFKERRTVGSRKDKIATAVFSPDGKTLATGGNDKVARIWDLTTGRELAVLRGHEGYVDRLAFSPCGRLLATATGSKYELGVRLWDVGSGRLLDIWRGHERGIYGLAFSPCGGILAAGVDRAEEAVNPRPGRVRFWDVVSRRECGMIGEVPGQLTYLAFAPTGSLLAIACAEAAYLYRVPTRMPTAALAIAKPFGGKALAISKQVAEWWDQLASSNAEEAYHAVWCLAGLPERAVSLFAQKIRPAASPDLSGVSRLIHDLGNEDFDTRERATQALSLLGEFAGPALREASRSADLETRRRAQRLLARLGPPLRDGERLRAIRAMEVLELIGTEDAQKLLAWLATGAPEATLTQEAAASLARLEKRAKLLKPKK